eukprot:2842612-Prymnesium_polylepis.1
MPPLPLHWPATHATYGAPRCALCRIACTGGVVLLEQRPFTQSTNDDGKPSRNLMTHAHAPKRSSPTATNDPAPSTPQATRLGCRRHVSCRANNCLMRTHPLPPPTVRCRYCPCCKSLFRSVELHAASGAHAGWLLWPGATRAALGG